MMPVKKSLLLIALITAVAISITTTTTNVNAESDAKRANDGFNDGSNAASTDVTFNPACDPTGAHTSDGQHSSIYCNAWSQGYISTWNSLHGGSNNNEQTQSQTQQQSQSQHNTCIALICRNIQSGSQGQDQGANQVNNP